MKTCRSVLPIINLALVLLSILGISFFHSVHAHTPKNREIKGIWQGTIKTPDFELRMIFVVSLSSGNTLTATMDVPEQNATDIPIDEVLFDGSTLQLEIKPIDGVYKGVLSDDGETIEGNWTQSGMTLPLVLERTEAKFEIKRPQEPKKPYPYKVEEVVFENNKAGVKLAGTLTLPSQKSRYPAVLLLSGSGPQDRDEMVFGHRPFLVLADYLTRRGVAVLRVDDRGVGGSTGNFEGATAVDFVSDAMACVAFLKSRREVDRECIGLIGHSEGGMIAPMVAVQSSDIAFIVMMASPGLAIVDMEYSEQARDLKARGASADFIAEMQVVQESLFEVIRKETDSEIVREKIDAIIRQSFKKLCEEEREKIGISEENLDVYIRDKVRRLDSPWFRYYLPYDTGTVLQKVTCPVLAINGEKDVNVLPKENLAAIKRALKTGGNTNYTVNELPDLNHLFQTAETGSVSEYGKIAETMSPRAMKLIADWILKQTKGNK
jgi:pimeloyl-ACP methyl ester carboxylesterase